MKTNLCRLQILETLEDGNVEVLFEDLSRNKNVILTLDSNHQIFSLLEQFGIVILEYENDTYPVLPEYSCYLHEEKKRQIKLQLELFFLLILFLAFGFYFAIKYVQLY